MAFDWDYEVMQKNDEIKEEKPVLPVEVQIVKQMGQSQPVRIAFVLGFLGIVLQILNYCVIPHVDGTIVISIIGAIPYLLMLLGLVIFCKDCKNELLTGKGLKLCRVGAIIQLICMCVLIMLILIVCVVLFIMAKDIFAEEVVAMEEQMIAFLRMFIIIFLVMLAAPYTCIIVWCVKMIKAVNMVRDIVKWGRSKKNISLFLIVFNWISVGASGFVILMQCLLFSIPFVDAYELGTAGMTPVLLGSSLCGMISMIFMNIALIKTRSKLEMVRRVPYGMQENAL